MASPFFSAVDAGVAALDVAAAAWLGAQAIAVRQRTRLRQMLQFAQSKSPLYARAWRGCDAQDLQLVDLPVVHRHGLMAHFDQWVTQPELRLDELRRFVADPACIGELFKGRYTVWESSGSSGEPGLFVQDGRTMAVYDALETQRRSSPRPWTRLMDMYGLGERLAFVGATGGHFASQVQMRRLLRLAPWLAGRWQSFSILQPLGELVAQLNHFAPTLLATYPTAAALLAGERRAGRLKVALQEVWTGGETLAGGQRAEIETGLACALRNSYGASEFLPIAWECSAGALHVNADWVVLEAVDARHRPVAAGQLSHTTLLTHLANRAQPLIRYDLGDRIVLPAQHCPCGSPLPLVQVKGRCDDVLRLAARSGEPVALLPLALSTLLEDDAGVFDFRLEQTGPSSLRLWLGPHQADALAAGQRAARVLKAFALRQGARALRVHLPPPGPLPRGRSGKLQRIVVRFPA